jgi:hypothetical protein
MNKLKVVSGTIAFVFLCFGLVLISSCKKKAVKYNDTTNVRPCENVICLNGGSCSDGYCQCPTGYEGLKCEKKWSDKFLGTYITSDECYTGPNGFYDVTIVADQSQTTKIIFYNLGTTCSSSPIEAVINPERTSFIFPMQNACGNNYISGYGNINTNGNYINVYLKSRDSANHTSLNCSMILNKKP